MDKEALKNFILKNSSDSRFYGLLYKEKQLLKENDLMGFAQYQLKKHKNIFIGSFSFLLVWIIQIPVQAIDFTETADLSFVYYLIALTIISGIVLFKSTKEYYTIKSSMEILIAVLEDEENTHELASDSSAILSKA